MTVIQYIVSRACDRYGHNGDEFCTANFQSELSDVTDSRPMATPQQVEVILQSTPGVTKIGLCQWKFERFEKGPAK